MRRVLRKAITPWLWLYRRPLIGWIFAVVVFGLALFYHRLWEDRFKPYSFSDVFGGTIREVDAQNARIDWLRQTANYLALLSILLGLTAAIGSGVWVWRKLKASKPQI